MEGVVGQVGMPAPVLPGSERRRSEHALDAELVLLGLHVFGDFLELVEALDLVDRLRLGVGQGEVLLHDGVVVDDSIALGGEGHAVDLAVFALERQIFLRQMLGELLVAQVGDVLLPVLQADGAVDVEEGRRVRLVDFRLERLLVVSGRRGADLDLDARLLLVFCRDFLPGLLSFGFEVEIVDRGFAVVFLVRAARAGREASERNRSRRHGGHDACGATHECPPLDKPARQSRRRGVRCSVRAELPIFYHKWRQL